MNVKWTDIANMHAKYDAVAKLILNDNFLHLFSDL